MQAQLCAMAVYCKEKRRSITAAKDTTSRSGLPAEAYFRIQAYLSRFDFFTSKAALSASTTSSSFLSYAFLTLGHSGFITGRSISAAITGITRSC